MTNNIPIILTPERPILALPRKSECQAGEQLVPLLTTLVCRGPGSNPVPPDLRWDTLPTELPRPVSLICVGPDQKPHCWFSHETAHILNKQTNRFQLQNKCIVRSESQHGFLIQMSCLTGKPTIWFPTRSDTNRAVQLQKRARILKFWI